MCCLFGFVDFGHTLSRKQRSQLLTILSIASEVRGTDATGIAYNHEGKLYIRKRPLPASKMWFRVPVEATVVMGHTRMATTGSPKRAENAHPFSGFAGQPFALAHNGIIQNDNALRRKQKLPATAVETDSYIAVQLLEQHGALSFNGLRTVAEQLEGPFNFSILSGNDDLWFVRGNNPLCLMHFPEAGIYIYASTEEILRKALRQLPFRLGKSEKIHLFSGELVKIDAQGKISRSHFDDSKLYCGFGSFWPLYEPAAQSEYLRDLKAVAPYFGLAPSDVDTLLAEGLSPEEIEEFIYL